jgi:hypothetical protein
MPSQNPPSPVRCSAAQGLVGELFKEPTPCVDFTKTSQADLTGWNLRATAKGCDGFVRDPATGELVVSSITQMPLASQCEAIIPTPVPPTAKRVALSIIHSVESPLQSGQRIRLDNQIESPSQIYRFSALPNGFVRTVVEFTSSATAPVSGVTLGVESQANQQLPSWRIRSIAVLHD